MISLEPDRGAVSINKYVEAPLAYKTYPKVNPPKCIEH